MFASCKKSSYEKQQEKFQKKFDKQMKKIIPDSGKPHLLTEFKKENKAKKNKISSLI